jgi:Family of unknown function (DUF6585)
MSHELGRMIARYKGRGVTGPFIGFILAAAVTLVSIWSYVDPSAPSWLRPYWVAGGIFLLVTGGAVINGLREYQVDIHEQGFVYSTVFETANVRWEDVSAVWQAKCARQRNGPTTSATYTVLLKNKKKLVLDNERFKNAEGLGDTIQKEVTRRLMPRYSELLKTGGTAKFGKLSISRQGLSNGKETILWAQVKAVRINNGIININKEGKWLGWANVMAYEIPNLFVFLGLIDQIVGIGN